MDYDEWAMQQVRETTSRLPSKRESERVEHLFAWAERDPPKTPLILQAISLAAARWGEDDLWHRAFGVCGADKMGVASIGHECFSALVEAFGMDDVQAKYVQFQVRPRTFWLTKDLQDGACTRHRAE